MGEINIGLLGCGTVGTGVAKILIESRDLIQSRIGATLNLKYIADIDLKTDRGIDFKDIKLTTDVFEPIGDPDSDIVVEMIGGEEIAKRVILKAIDHGKQVVTANKALLASQGNLLFKAAAEKGVDLAFEACSAVCSPATLAAIAFASVTTSAIAAWRWRATWSASVSSRPRSSSISASILLSTPARAWARPAATPDS